MFKFFKQQPEKGFTLIELLLVITIIGILSGLCIVGMAAAVDSARVAKAKDFAHSIEQQLGPNNKGKWNFNNVEYISGHYVASDSSGQGNSAIFEGNATTSSDNPIGSGGKSVSFDGVDSKINAGDTDSLKPTDELTVSLWFKPFEYNQNFSFSTLVSSRYYPSSPFLGYLLGLEFDGRLIAYISDKDGNTQTVHSAQTAELNKWHHAALTADGSTFKIYLDGREGEEKTYSGPMTYYSGLDQDEVWMGDASISGKDFKGLVDNVQVYSGAFKASAP